MYMYTSCYSYLIIIIIIIIIILIIITCCLSLYCIQKSGVHINSEYTPYTVEYIKSILESTIDPLVNNVGKEATPITSLLKNNI